MDIYDLINDYLEHLEVEKGRSKKTVENYRLYLYRYHLGHCHILWLLSYNHQGVTRHHEIIVLRVMMSSIERD